MNRIIARLLLVVLLGGTFAPFAAAASMQMPHPHCARKPMGSMATAPDPGMPECHHHAASSPAHKSAAEPGTPHQFDSSQCCRSHECCRSMAQSQWAQVSLRRSIQTFAPAAALTPSSHATVRSFELALYRPVRAPPQL